MAQQRYLLPIGGLLALDTDCEEERGREDEVERGGDGCLTQHGAAHNKVDSKGA